MEAIKGAHLVLLDHKVFVHDLHGKDAIRGLAVLVLLRHHTNLRDKAVTKNN